MTPSRLQNFLLDVFCTVTPFPNKLPLAGRMGSIYFGRLLSILLCHWLVGRSGRRGLLDVVHLLGTVSFVCGSREGWSEGVVCNGG